MASKRVNKADPPKEGGRKSRGSSLNYVGPPTVQNMSLGAPQVSLEQLAENLLAVLFEEFEKLKRETFTIVDKGRVRANPRIRGFVQLFTALRPYAKLLSKPGEEMAGILDAAVMRWREQSE